MREVLLASIITLAIPFGAVAQHHRHPFVTPSTIHRSGPAFQRFSYPSYHGRQRHLGIRYGRGHIHHGHRFKHYGGSFRGHNKIRYSSPKGVVIQRNYRVREKHLVQPTISGVHHHGVPFGGRRIHRSSALTPQFGRQPIQSNAHDRHFKPLTGAHRRHNSAFIPKKTIHYGGGYPSRPISRGSGYIEFEGGVRVNFGP